MVGPAIEMIDVGKQYRLGELRRNDSIKDALSEKIFRTMRHGRRSQPEIWALRGVSLQLDEGQALGVVGRNGAGKSTLLKILGRITEPTEGISRTKGRVASLLEVGTGFHPELTGRENVFLNGAILGMSRREIRQRFDAIVDFSGVAEFLDTPVKRYSSGMQLRLAFAVAAHLEPDILIVDEVLAVGDFEFQKKCLRRMAEVEKEGRTVVFVSHDLEAIARLCPSAVWLEKGSVQQEGTATHVIDSYLASAIGEGVPGKELVRSGPFQLHSVVVSDESGRRSEVLRRDGQIYITVDYALEKRFGRFDLALYVVNSRGTRIFDEHWSDRGTKVPEGPGRYTVTLTVPPILNVDEYRVGLWAGTVYETLVDQEVSAVFRLEGSVKGRPDRAVELMLPWDLISSDEPVSDPSPDGSTQ
jgi:ABC-type polysaccharide/polyol phosphate transport system ATPase subunit